MEYATAISKMNEYLIKAAQLCRKWLEPRLRRIDSRDWWQSTVCSNLSDMQLEQVQRNNVTTL